MQQRGLKPIRELQLGVSGGLSDIQSLFSPFTPLLRRLETSVQIGWGVILSLLSDNTLTD